MSSMTRGFRKLAKVAGVNVILHEALHPRKPIIPGDEFIGSGDTKMSEQWSVVMLFDNIYAERFRNINKVLVEQ